MYNYTDCTSAFYFYSVLIPQPKVSEFKRRIKQNFMMCTKKKPSGCSIIYRNLGCAFKLVSKSSVGTVT